MRRVELIIQSMRMGGGRRVSSNLDIFIVDIDGLHGTWRTLRVCTQIVYLFIAEPAVLLLFDPCCQCGTLARARRLRRVASPLSRPQARRCNTRTCPASSRCPWQLQPKHTVTASGTACVFDNDALQILSLKQCNKKALAKLKQPAATRVEGAPCTAPTLADSARCLTQSCSQVMPCGPLQMPSGPEATINN
jgi:hypothetical protein